MTDNLAARWTAWRALPLWLLIIGGLVALGVVLVSHVRVRGTAVPLSPSRVDGDLILTGFSLSTLLNGEREWEVSAARARLFEPDHHAVLDEVRGTVRLRNGSLMQFEGVSAIFDTVSHDLDLEGQDLGAVVTLPNGFVLRANRLRWTQEQGELSSDDSIVLVGPRLSIRGVGLRAWPSSQEFTILNSVRADVSS
jgi:LPS export ABC transporter protein LptC